MISNPEYETQLSFVHKSRSVKVTLSFPSQSDPKAVQDFFTRLKELYFEKIGMMAALQGPLPVSSPKTDEWEESIFE